MDAKRKIAVIGLGYVGLPLALALSRQFHVVGIDIDRTRVDELSRGVDRTNEVRARDLGASMLTISSDPEHARGATVFIVTVPTPVDKSNQPDLRPLLDASRMVAALLEQGQRATIVYESTVYPGVTEDICGALLAEVSGLRRGSDFVLGYSPERINPGDRDHSVEKITKVVAGENGAVLDDLAQIYGAITSGGVLRAASIKAAEAAKVIENAQRDINIAFMNEVTQIFARLGLSIWDVLEAANSKWNFLPFTPGLVGGHCIGVDPFYLSFRARELGIEPRLVLAGRELNDGMAAWVADECHSTAGKAGTALVLGITFKADVPDTRNSKVVDLVNRLHALGHVVTVHDPLVNSLEASAGNVINCDPQALMRRYDLVVLAVAHRDYRAMAMAEFEGLLKEGGLLADLPNALAGRELSPSVRRWTL